MSLLPVRRRGAAAIEFALWLPVLMLFISAVVDWGVYMTTRVTVARAVMEGTRSGAAIFEPPNVPPGSRILPRTIARTTQVFTDMGVPCGSPDCFQVTVCAVGQGGPCKNPPVPAIVIEASLPYNPFFGFIPTPSNITERFEMAVER